jgi:thioredoxin-dependent peroxiredoxin
MKHAFLVALAALAGFSLSTPANAQLAIGALAPDFATQGAMAGNDFPFRLSDALKKGPVVLYFYPKAFTPGCTMEAHAFAAAIDDFHKAGATVMGMSADDLPTLKRFSTSECQSKFPVAVASPAVVQAYHVAFLKPDGTPRGITNRTSYVIAPDGRIKFVHSNLDWHDHVKLTLAAVQALSTKP